MRWAAEMALPNLNASANDAKLRYSEHFFVSDLAWPIDRVYLTSLLTVG